MTDVIGGFFAILLWTLVIFGPITFIVYKVTKNRREKERQQAKTAERKRIEGCGNVVLFYANHLGYIARQCISRDELEELINAGITPDDLSDEISVRINQVSVYSDS